MLAKTHRNIACLLALALGVALSSSSAGTASAATPGSDPSALAVLHQVEAMYATSPPAPHARMTMPSQPQSETSVSARGTDGTALMIELARALPRLDSADRATAMRALSAPASTTSPCTADEQGTPSDGSHFVTDTTAHFTVTYTTTFGDNDAVTQDYAIHVENVLEHVYDTEITQMGFNAPLSPLTANPLTDPSPRTPIALCNIQNGFYGFCSPIPALIGNAQPAACVLRNDYSGYMLPYDNGNADAPLDVTAAHEF
ncbi:MAG TPA: hypothetical protein VN108_10010, partial [Marmoricola sp.]|nr:hypothetical protein [Marmoricola sp.]